MTGQPNAFEAAVPLQLGERTVTLRLDWRTSAALIEEIGPNWGAKLRSACMLVEQSPDSIDQVAKIISILCRREDPDVTPEMVMDASPPLVPVADALGAVHRLFYWGHPGLQEDEDETEEEAKGDRPLATRTSWSRFGGQVLERVFRRGSSGSFPASKHSNGSVPDDSATTSS